MVLHPHQLARFSSDWSLNQVPPGPSSIHSFNGSVYTYRLRSAAAVEFDRKSEGTKWPQTRPPDGCYVRQKCNIFVFSAAPHLRRCILLIVLQYVKQLIFGGNYCTIANRWTAPRFRYTTKIVSITRIFFPTNLCEGSPRHKFRNRFSQKALHTHLHRSTRTPFDRLTRATIEVWVYRFFLAILFLEIVGIWPLYGATCISLYFS